MLEMKYWGKKRLVPVFVGTVYWLNYHQKQQSAIAMMANAAKDKC